MALGTVFCGFLISSDALDICSNPKKEMYIRAVAEIIPVNPKGANGSKLGVFTKGRQSPMKTKSMATLARVKIF